MGTKEAEAYTQFLMNEIGFRGDLVDIDTFLDDPYFLGNVFKTEYDSQGRVITGIFPYWREYLRNLFPTRLLTKSSYVVHTGCIGAGKSTVGKVILLYDSYKYSRMNNVKRFSGALLDKGCTLKMFSVAKYKIYPDYDEMKEILLGGACPYFKDELKYGNWFLNNLHISLASDQKSLVSEDVFSFLMSELNEMKPDKAEVCLKLAEQRLWSRFRAGQNLCSHLIMDSSARNEGSVIDKFITESPQAKDAVIVRPTHWDSRKGMGIYKNEDTKKDWLNLYLGDSRYSPFLIEDNRDIARLKLDEDQIIKVPPVYYKEVKGTTGKVLESFIQDVCGRSTSSSFRFIRDSFKITAAMKLNKFYPDVIKMDFYDKEDNLWNILQNDVLMLPKDRRLYIGLDAGTNSDLFGLAIGYADGLRRINEADGGKLDYLTFKVPIAIGLSRYDGQETNYSKVHDFILRLADDYDVAMIWTDQYMSTPVRQIFIQNGLNSERKSIDMNDSAYMTFKQYLYQGLIDLPKSEQLQYEIAGLVREQKGSYMRVYKPRDERGHGDVCSAVVQVIDGMVNLGPNEVLLESRMNMNKLTSMYENRLTQKPRVIGLGGY